MREEFLAKLKEAEAIGENEVFRYIYRSINGAFHAGKFAEVNEIFATVDASTISTAANVAMLAYSGVAKDKLPARGIYHAAAMANCEKLEGKSKAFSCFGPLA